MSTPFDFEKNAFREGFEEIEEGVYYKHYGIELSSETEIREFPKTESFGDYEIKAQFWEKQMSANTECIALKAIIAHSLNEDTIQQVHIEKECLEKGFYRPEWGTSFDDVLEILKLDLNNKQENFDVEVLFNSSLMDLTEHVDSNGEVVCYVNRMLLEYDGSYNFPGLNADSLIHVIGIVFGNAEDDYVVINDVSREDGAGIKISLDNFLNAWATSGNIAITVFRR